MRYNLTQAQKPKLSSRDFDSCSRDHHQAAYVGSILKYNAFIIVKPGNFMAACYNIKGFLLYKEITLRFCAILRG